jgi:hypothetical protein
LSAEASTDGFPPWDNKTIPIFAQLGRAVLESADFAEAALVEDPNVIDQVLGLLQQAAGKLSRLNWLMFDPGTQPIGEEGEDWVFKGQAAQALSVVKSQYYAFTINGKTGQMVYKLTNPVAAAQFSETEEAYEFAAATGKKLNCASGNIQCGGKCQNGKLNCFHSMTPAQKKAAGAAAKTAKEVATKSPSPASTPVPSVKTAIPKTTSTKVKTGGLSSTDLTKGFEYSSHSSFTRVGDAGGWDVVKDRKGASYVAKRPSAASGIVAFDTASEVVGAQFVRLVGGKTADLKVEKDNEPDTPKLLYSKFVPGDSVATIRAVGVKPAPFEKDGLMLSKEKALDSAIAHPDLARIYAADLVMGNGDRHDGNIFYDSRSKSYHAIDNEGAFSSSHKSSFRSYQSDAIKGSLKSTLSRTDLTKEEMSNLKTFKSSVDKLLAVDEQELSKTINKTMKSFLTDDEKGTYDSESTGRTEIVRDNFDFVRQLMKSHDADFKRLGI